MTQSTFHLAIIMDGNGRWAQARGWPRAAGHRAGVEAVRRVVRAARRQGVTTLTLYAFSSDNWRRGTAEVAALMALLEIYLRRECAPLARAGVRVAGVGRRDRIPPDLVEALAEAEAATRHAQGLLLRLAIDYSARAEIARAAAAAGPRIPSGAGTAHPSLAQISFALEGASGPVDLLIRTGGEQRLSDFLLWEAAYAELWFTRTAWPDFGARQLRRALDAFHHRQRRFGGLAPGQAAGGAR